MLTSLVDLKGLTWHARRVLRKWGRVSVWGDGGGVTGLAISSGQRDIVTTTVRSSTASTTSSVPSATLLSTTNLRKPSPTVKEESRWSVTPWVRNCTGHWAAEDKDETRVQSRVAGNPQRAVKFFGISCHHSHDSEAMETGAPRYQHLHGGIGVVIRGAQLKGDGNSPSGGAEPCC